MFLFFIFALRITLIVFRIALYPMFLCDSFTLGVCLIYHVILYTFCKCSVEISLLYRQKTTVNNKNIFLEIIQIKKKHLSVFFGYNIIKQVGNCT